MGMEQVYTIIIIGVLTICGILLSFAGLKFLRIWKGLFGVLLGTMIARVIAVVIVAGENLTLGLVVACAAIIGLISFTKEKAGSFIFGFVSVFCTLTGLFVIDDWRVVSIFAGIALIMGILIMIWMDPVIILTSAMVGAFFIKIDMEIISGWMGWKIFWVIFIVPILIFIAGLTSQFLMKSKEIGRKEIQYSNQIKKEESMESEVEMARNILEEVDNKEQIKEDSESEFETKYSSNKEEEKVVITIEK